MGKAVELGFKSAIVYNNLSIAYNKIAKVEKAEQMFLEAIKHDENYWFAYINISKLYALKEKYIKVIQYFEKAKKLGVNAKFVDSYISVLRK